MNQEARGRQKKRIAERREKVAGLYLLGYSLRAMARECDVTHVTIYHDIEALHREWIKLALVDMDKAKARELARLDHVEHEAWRGWLRSLQDHERVTEERERGKAGAKTSTMREGQAGDPRFLATALSCVERRCKILGLDKPSKLELTGKGGGPIQTELRKQQMTAMMQDSEFREGVRQLQRRAEVLQAQDSGGNGNGKGLRGTDGE